RALKRRWQRPDWSRRRRQGRHRLRIYSRRGSFRAVHRASAACRGTVICGLLLLVVSAPVAGQKGGKTVSDNSVTSTISDTDATGLPYDVQSDGLGSYQNNVNGVTSILQASANYAWLLSTYDSSFIGSSGRNALINLAPSNQESATATLPSIWS